MRIASAVGDSFGLRSCATIESTVKDNGAGLVGEVAGSGGRSFDRELVSGVIGEIGEILRSPPNVCMVGVGLSVMK